MISGITQSFDHWCVIEVLGHRVMTGRVTEVQLAGAGFLRVDIPDGRGEDYGFCDTVYLPPGSVYALHVVSEALARTVATDPGTDMGASQRWRVNEPQPERTPWDDPPF